MGLPMSDTNVAPTILIVDDESAMRRVLTKMLASEGFDVVEAASHREEMADGVKKLKSELKNAHAEAGVGGLAKVIAKKYKALPS